MNYENIKQMEEKERDLLDRLRTTIQSVEEFESKVRVLEGGRRKAKIKQAKSIVAGYIHSPLNSIAGNSNCHRQFEKQIKKNKATFKQVEIKEDPMNSNNSFKEEYQMPENGQARD
jgi:hypothetical protein